MFYSLGMSSGPLLNEGRFRSTTASTSRKHLVAIPQHYEVFEEHNETPIAQSAVLPPAGLVQLQPVRCVRLRRVRCLDMTSYGNYMYAAELCDIYCATVYVYFFAVYLRSWIARLRYFLIYMCIFVCESCCTLLVHCVPATLHANTPVACTANHTASLGPTTCDKQGRLIQ